MGKKATKKAIDKKFGNPAHSLPYNLQVQTQQVSYNHKKITSAHKNVTHQVLPAQFDWKQYYNKKKNNLFTLIQTVKFMAPTFNIYCFNFTSSKF